MCRFIVHINSSADLTYYPLQARAERKRKQVRLGFGTLLQSLLNEIDITEDCGSWGTKGLRKCEMGLEHSDLLIVHINSSAYLTSYPQVKGPFQTGCFLNSPGSIQPLLPLLVHSSFPFTFSILPCPVPICYFFSMSVLQPHQSMVTSQNSSP